MAGAAAAPAAGEGGPTVAGVRVPAAGAGAAAGPGPAASTCGPGAPAGERQVGPGGGLGPGAGGGRVEEEVHRNACPGLPSPPPHRKDTGALSETPVRETVEAQA